MRIIAPENFKNVPWKNGLGYTLELAISANSTLANFDWRLSIATVSENGLFSDFSGYSRNLVLIDGEGISLCHDERDTDDLTKKLQFARFDGGNKTVSRLHQGAIKDFNVMVNAQHFDADVCTFEQVDGLHIFVEERAFVYGLTQDIQVTDVKSTTLINLPAHHLLEIEAWSDFHEASHQYQINGKDIILVKIERRK